MNSDRMLIIFYKLFIFYLKYLFTHQLINDNYSVENDNYSVENDNYSVENDNYSVENDNYSVKKCHIFFEYFEFNQIVYHSDYHLW
jgi:hypothetical protein